MRYRIGDRVQFLKGKLHEGNPEHYPPEGTVGTVLRDFGSCLHVQWPKGSLKTSGPDAEWKRQCFIRKSKVKAVEG